MSHRQATTPRSCWALAPLKAAGGAKSRLASCLSPSQRASLQLAMLSDVLAALSHARSLAGIVVVTGDAMADARIAGFGAQALRERGSSLDPNGAVRQGIDHLRALGAHHALVVPLDIPLLDPVEVDRAVRIAEFEGTPS